MAGTLSPEARDHSLFVGSWHKAKRVHCKSQVLGAPCKASGSCHASLCGGNVGGQCHGTTSCSSPPRGRQAKAWSTAVLLPQWGRYTLLDCWHDVPPQFLHSRLPLAQQPPVSQGRCSGGQGGFPMCWGRAMALRLHDSGSPLLAHSPPGRPVSPTPADGLQLVMRG